ncbi:MAG: sulfur carrier protein ThiS [Robiginitomaculum sp.]
MYLIVNGETIEGLPEAMSVAALLAHLTLPVTKIAVERNLEIVPKSTFKQTRLSEGDRLEIIHFIGGG